MKKFFLVCLILVTLFVPKFVLAQTPEEQYREKQKEIEELEKKVSELENQAKTLSSQIAYMNNQIQLTSLKIAQTEDEIVMLSEKIGKLEVSLDSLAQVLGRRVVVTYEKGKIDTVSLLFSSKGFSDFISRFKYLKVMQIHDRAILLSMEETRTNYDDQRSEVEKLQSKLEGQKKLLDQQKKDKQSLLDVTKSDEKRYKDMLARARAEQAAIEKILAGQGSVAQIGPVKAGDMIGTYITGASPCSSGTHLHFEVVKDSARQNPANFLNNTSLIFADNVGVFTPSGSWSWPISDPIRINQEYGSTFWSRLGWYGGSSHTGIDMVSGSTAVKSVQDGTLFRGAISCGGGSLRYARVDQSDGIQTFYLHLN